MNRRELLIAAGGTAGTVGVVGAAGYFGGNFGNAGTASIAVENAAARRHTIAILLTNEAGKRTWFDGTLAVDSNETERIDDAVTFEYAPEVVARLLLDTGNYTQFAISIENGAVLRFRIETDGTITRD